MLRLSQLRMRSNRRQFLTGRESTTIKGVISSVFTTATLKKRSTK